MAYGDPTGVNKILVEKYGYEWVNGKARITWCRYDFLDDSVPRSTDLIFDLSTTL